MSHIPGAIPENLLPEQLSQDPLLPEQLSAEQLSYLRSICRRSNCRRSNCRIFGASVAGAIVGGAIVAGANVGRANVAGANVSEHLSRSICRVFRSNCRRSICHGTPKFTPFPDGKCEHACCPLWCRVGVGLYYIESICYDYNLQVKIIIRRWKNHNEYESQNLCRSLL